MRPPELELEHDTSSGETLGVDPASHPPQQHQGVELGGAWLAERPLGPPAAQGVDDLLQGLARVRQPILDVLMAGDVPLEDGRVLETAQTVHEQRA